eukprot:gb/GEZN01012739.1/.p1 GENE.gb/GEZN01012739.1/~~gb/GEZN01012739.1/.p1  ORF type:complete len:134 (+),score=22.50 gb/GEZN01012739.1/:505-906(+)
MSALFKKRDSGSSREPIKPLPCKNKTCIDTQEKYARLLDKSRVVTATMEKFKEENKNLLITTAQQLVSIKEQLDQVTADNNHLARENAHLRKTLTKAIKDGVLDMTLDDLGDSSAHYASPVQPKLKHSNSFIV